MQLQTPNFPFTAVTGQSLFKLALTLAVINPAIGGVLISGPRGAAKSTLAKGLADVMPEANGKTPPFVTLPLGVTEEMVIGTLNLQQVLDQKQVEFQPGLLAKADEGVLYVDEVNLLQDNIVDLLLDVAASGVNQVERDGISHNHKAEFILLGTMNPDEGELRPQLQDRFGLSVELNNEYSIAERMEIVQRQEWFDEDKESFAKEYSGQQAQLKHDILETRALLPEIQFDDELRELVAHKCHDAGVEGLRADIVWYRSAVAHAALHKRLSVTGEDILAVEELVLNHRRKHQSTPPEPPQKPPEKPFSRPSPKTNGNPQTDGDWGVMEPQQHKTADSIDFEMPTRSFNRQTPSQKEQVSAVTASKKSGKFQGLNNKNRHSSGHVSRKVNWLSSLLTNAGQWPLRQLRFCRPTTSQPVLHLVLLDTSASTLKNHLFAEAKAVILTIAKQAYLAREQLSIVGFGNQCVETLLSKQRTPKVLRAFLDDIPAAGGTPFREALEHAVQFQQQQLRRAPGLLINTYIITDGKTRQSFAHVDLIGDVTLIDVEKSLVKRGKGKRIADDLNAAYVPLFA